MGQCIEGKSVDAGFTVIFPFIIIIVNTIIIIAVDINLFSFVSPVMAVQLKGLAESGTQRHDDADDDDDDDDDDGHPHDYDPCHDLDDNDNHDSQIIVDKLTDDCHPSKYSKFTLRALWRN